MTQPPDRPTTQISQSRPMRWVWMVIGFLALALGAIGVVLPILPTTPFVILAAFAFGKASPRLQAWLENTKTFGPMIADWKAHGAIAPKYKKMAVGMMLAAIGLSIYMCLPAHVVVIQCILITGAATYVLTRPHGPE